MIDSSLNKAKKSKNARPFKIIRFSAEKAKREAQKIVASNQIHTLGLNVLTALATAGILSVEHINLLTNASPRTITKYSNQGYIFKSYPNEQTSAYIPTRTHLCILGDLGLAIAKLKKIVPDDYELYNLDNETCDLFCAEMITRLLRSLSSSGYKFKWHGAEECRLYRKGNVFLEPNALITVSKRDWKKTFVMQYHAESHVENVGSMVARYEAAYLSKTFWTQWHLSEFPTVLIGSTHSEVIDGYIYVLEQLGEHRVNCQYFIKSIGNATSEENDLTQWANLNKVVFSDNWDFQSIL